MFLHECEFDLLHFHTLDDDVNLVLAGRASQVRDEDDLFVGALGALREVFHVIECDDDGVQPVCLLVRTLDVFLHVLEKIPVRLGQSVAQDPDVVIVHGILGLVIPAQDDPEPVGGLGEEFPLDELNGAGSGRLQESRGTGGQSNVQDETHRGKLKQ